jgi:nucleotide-binding universal stress UspA family protein
MKLLVALDLSEPTELIVKKAADLAREMSAQVWILHNAEPEPDVLEFRTDPQGARDSLAEKFHREHRQIQDIAKRLRGDGLKATALLVHGPTVEMILKEASELEVDMIIVGSHGRSAVFQLLLGSVSEGVLRKSRCPVLVVPTRKTD